ncbi:MAG: type II restriction endonuclease [Elusimicrobiota bacterium]
MIIDVYSKCLNMDKFDKIVENFHETIIDTNRDHKFFVDWEKVKNNVDKHRIEFNILNSLIGSEDFDKDLMNILSKYPEVIPCIPILIALRDVRLKVIDDFYCSDIEIVKYDFSKRKLSPGEIEDFVEFFNKTGLKYFFTHLSSRSIEDYVAGVEVGMDTHARKNRSGSAMEVLLKPLIEEINHKLGIRHMLFQKQFRRLKKEFDIDVSSSLKNRKADFIILKSKDNIINIEVNFYSGTGSKPQEIVDSYINRQEELRENGFKFIWITDGFGWKGQKNQIQKGFEKVDYLLNLNFVRQGVLEEILCQI